MTVYWSKVVVCLALTAAAVLLCIFCKAIPTEVLAVIMGLLMTIGQSLLPPVEKAKSMFPPPMPPGDKP